MGVEEGCEVEGGREGNILGDLLKRVLCLHEAFEVEDEDRRRSVDEELLCCCACH